VLQRAGVLIAQILAAVIRQRVEPGVQEREAVADELELGPPAPYRAIRQLRNSKIF